MNESKKAKLEILGLEVPLSTNTHFCDLGYTKDLRSKANELCVQHQGIMPYLEKNIDGITISFNDIDGSRWVYILYMKKILPSLDIRLRAHEETHALKHIGGLRFLEDAIEKEFGVGISLSSFSAETLAEIGAFYAMYKYKISRFGFLIASLSNPTRLYREVKKVYDLLQAK